MARIIYKDGCEGQNRLECIEGIEIDLLNGQKALIYPKYSNEELLDPKDRDRLLDAGISETAALGVLLEMVWGIQTMGARMARALDAIGARNCLVQRKRHAFNEAKKNINGLLKGLEVAFDETFDYAMCRVPEGMAERTEALQSYADDIVRLLILYYSRVDGSPDGMEKRARIHRAVANFKAVPGFDAEALIRFFKMR